MKQSALLLSVVIALTMSAFAQTPKELADLWEKYHIATKFPSDARHADLKIYLEKLRQMSIPINEVGKSHEGREIYQMQFGRGPLKIFMWSQMHGDEPTATSTLVDMFAFFQQNRDLAWVKEIEDKLTIRAVPMLNPDGAEVYKRHNAQNLDINRDALNLKSPEAQLLKRLRDEWQPAIGFNLHNQRELTTVGNAPRQAAISLLVVYGDAAKTPSDGHSRNERIASVMVRALNEFIPGHIGRYGDEWTPTAFGDNFSAWGTPVILVETGALYGKDEKFLVKMNFVAFITAIRSIVTGSERTQDPNLYINLPENGSGGLVSFVFRGAGIVYNDGSVKVGDISAVTQRRRASFLQSNVISGLGSIGKVRGLEEYDGSQFNVVQRLGQMATGKGAEFYFFKRDRAIDWTTLDVAQTKPDAVFSFGKWTVGDGKVPRR
ncbi:MAG: hypothetical protein JNL64_05825 [Blastocatellia bacterium]|nr:hypothetical protein [Blastocatellia bacterium]